MGVRAADFQEQRASARRPYTRRAARCREIWAHRGETPGERGGRVRGRASLYLDPGVSVRSLVRRRVARSGRTGVKRPASGGAGSGAERASASIRGSVAVVLSADGRDGPGIGADVVEAGHFGVGGDVVDSELVAAGKRQQEVTA